VQGDLGFARGATYAVQVSPEAAGTTSVTGTATLGGAGVTANFAKGSYVTRQYSILDANSISGNFGQLVSTNLLPIFSASLSKDANHVFLNVTVSGNGGGGGGGGGEGGGGGGGGPVGDPLKGYNVNQRNVMIGFGNSFIMTGEIIPAEFATMSAAGLTQVSGETAVGTQQATFDAMGQFMGVMLDPAMAGRGDSPRNAMASMPRKAPVVEDFNSRWAVWAAGFGGSQSINGDAVLGSNKTTSSVYGSAVGADYRLSPNTVAGFALAGGGTSFRVANGGSGNSDLFQAGGYLRPYAGRGLHRRRTCLWLAGRHHQPHRHGRRLRHPARPLQRQRALGAAGRRLSGCRRDHGRDALCGGTVHQLPPAVLCRAGCLRRQHVCARL
jgi:hypothetical protein